MTTDELKNKISEHKECCKKLAEEYRQRYNEDNTDKLALNMFYHNVIAYNNFETVLATIEDRNSMIMCFSNPPILTEETVEVDIKHIAELEKENAELRKIAEFQQSSNMQRHFENKKLKEGLAVGETFNKALNSMNKSLEEERDKYRDMVFDLQEENAELKGLKDVATLIRANNDTVTTLMQLNNMLVSKTQQLTKAKNLLQKVADVCGYPNYDIPVELYANIADFLKESEVEK